MFIPEIPDNSLKPLLEKLVYIADKFHSEAEEEDIPGKKFKFNPPATDEEIVYLENSLDTVLPTGYKDFLKFSNGMRLCGYMAQFDSIKRVVSLHQMEKSPDFPKDYIAIADIIGDGEILCFSKETKKFIRYFDGQETIYDDFYKFFEWLIDFIKESVEEYVDL